MGPTDDKLAADNANEAEQILQNWQPDPLVPDVDQEEYEHLLNSRVSTSKPGKLITVDGKQCLNLGSNNFLGLADHPKLEDVSIAAVRKYGVGSCGPRGFYGTMDIHLALEKALADFLGLQETVLYAFGFSTIASAIPAYAKSSDIIFVDQQCNFAIQQGMIASRAKIIKFKHNDASNLEDLVETTLKGKKNVRTFLVVESIYAKTGKMCPLKELVRIKRKFKIRLFIDESNSFGVLGRTGKGITEHLDVNINDLDMIMVSLENALCAFGGFCAGSTYVIDHQRLAGAGYCFSASLPPLQVQVAFESLKLIVDDQSIPEKARAINRYAHTAFSRLLHLVDISDPVSPVKILVPKDWKESSVNNIVNDSRFNRIFEKKLSKVSNFLLEEHRIALPVNRYNENDEMTMPPVSLRANISACLDEMDIDRVVDAINQYSF